MNRALLASITGSLIAARAAIDAALHALQSADAAVVEEPDTAEEAPVECQHPREERKDLSAMGSPERWKCTVCGYRYDAGKEE